MKRQYFLKTTWSLWQCCPDRMRPALIERIKDELPQGTTLDKEEPVGLDAKGNPVSDKYEIPVWAVWYAS